MTSLKKSIAALAATLPLAAFAQQAAAPAPLYQIYGTLNLNMQYIDAYGSSNFGATPGRFMSGRMALSTDSSNIGIRGTADTGKGGIGVVYQCETSANLDGEGVSGICNRNSRIGIGSDFGTLFYGNWDSPYKALAYGTKADDPFGNTDVYDAAAIIGSPGFKTRSSGARSTGGTTANTLLSFNQRAGNSVVYHSPKVMGLQAKAQYSANEFQNRKGDIAPALYSAGLNYDNGPLSLAIGYERHDDYGMPTIGGGPLTVLNTATANGNSITIAVPSNSGALNRSTKDQGVKMGAGFEVGSGFGTTTIGGQGEYLKYSLAHPRAGEIQNLHRWAWMAGLKHRLGDHELRARYMRALALSAHAQGIDGSFKSDGTGADNFTVGYAFYLSKAAQIYLYASWLKNERNASYTFATGGPAQLTSTTAGEDWTAGADPFAAGLGMRYAF